MNAFTKNAADVAMEQAKIVIAAAAQPTAR